MQFEEPQIRIALAAAAGAATALSFARWKEMSAFEIAMTLTAGFSFAFFVAPWLGHVIFGIPTEDTRAVCGLTYVFGSGSNILLPVVIRRIKRLLETGESL